MSANKIIKSVLLDKNFEEVEEKLKNDIQRLEKELKEQIASNHEEIIANCMSISNLEYKSGIEQITSKMNDFTVSLLLNQNNLKENNEITEKCNTIYDKLLNFVDIFEKLTNNIDPYNNYINYKQIHTESKMFKNYTFYDKLKALVNTKKQNLCFQLKEQASNWTGNVLSLYGEIGSKVLQDEPINRNELNLTEVMVPLYIFKKLNMEEEFYDTFNAKRQKISNHLKIYEMIGFLFVENHLARIDIHFVLSDFNTGFDKEELIVLIKFIKKYGFDVTNAEQRLEKICCDWILENKQSIGSKEDINLFQSKGEEFLKNVNEATVIEMFYKALDDVILKYYDAKEIEERIKKVHAFKETEYVFKASDKIKKLRENWYKTIDDIFNKEEYEQLKNIMFDEETVFYIAQKFVDCVKKVDGYKEKLVEGEIVKFYAYLQRYNVDLAAKFFSHIEKFVDK